MERDRTRWNERYLGDDLTMGEAPSRFLSQNLEILLSLTPGRRALDLACGEGRNSIFLAQHGYRVTGVDISERGLEKGRKWSERLGLDVDFLAVDLDDWSIPGEWDLILDINFLDRRLFGRGYAALAPGGVFMVDTLMEGEAEPFVTQRSHLLKRGELRAIFGGFDGELVREVEVPSGSPPWAAAIFRKSP